MTPARKTTEKTTRMKRSKLENLFRHAGDLYRARAKVNGKSVERSLRTVVKTFRDKLPEIFPEGRCISPALVHEELDAVGTGALSAWADERSSIWVPNAEILAGALAIQSRFPGLLDPKAEQDEADAYVIALARQRDGMGNLRTWTVYDHSTNPPLLDISGRHEKDISAQRAWTAAAPGDRGDQE